MTLSKSGSGTTSLGVHDLGRPSLTDTNTNLLASIRNNTVEDVPTPWPKLQIIKTHGKFYCLIYIEITIAQFIGIFMITAWILLASSAIMFAAWMKPVLPNGEWFQVHRALMIASLIVGALGFIFAFIGNARSQIPGLINFSPDVSVLLLDTS